MNCHLSVQGGILCQKGYTGQQKVVPVSRMKYPMSAQPLMLGFTSTCPPACTAQELAEAHTEPRVREKHFNYEQKALTGRPPKNRYGL